MQQPTTAYPKISTFVLPGENRGTCTHTRLRRVNAIRIGEADDARANGFLPLLQTFLLQTLEDSLRVITFLLSGVYSVKRRGVFVKSICRIRDKHAFLLLRNFNKTEELLMEKSRNK